MRKRRLAGMVAMAAAAMAARRVVRRRRRRAFDPARPSTPWGATALDIDGEGGAR